MSEQDPKAQEQSTSQNTNNETRSSQSEKRTQETDEPRVPKHRFDEVNRRMKEAEQTLQKMQQEQEQQQEERAQKQGEYQQLAEKRLKKVQSLEQELKQVKADWTKERRMNVWSQGAQGTIKAEAIADAFSFLSDDELNNIDDTDPEAYTQLAQNLVEVKPYLAAEGPRGAGSGGSSVPVLGHRGSPNGQQRGTQTKDRQPLFHEQARKRRPWK